MLAKADSVRNFHSAVKSQNNIELFPRKFVFMIKLMGLIFISHFNFNVGVINNSQF